MTTTPNPTEAQIERAAVAMQAESSGFFSMEAWRHLARAALVAATTTPQPVLDLEKVAALIESERDRAAAERDFAQESLGQFMAPALCEAAKRGELSQVNPVAISPERVKNVGDSLHVAPELVIDEAALAEVIGKVTDLWDEPLDEVHDIPQIARAVAAWLKEGAKR